MDQDQEQEQGLLPVFVMNQNTIVVSLENLQEDNQGLFLQLFGFPNPDALPIPESLPVESRGVRRPHPEDEADSPSKRPRFAESQMEDGQEQEQEQDKDPTELMLRTGEFLYFNQGEPTNILLHKGVEPDILIRKIISKMPTTLHGRLQYLYKFIKTAESPFEDDTERRYYDDIRDRVLAAYMKESKLRHAFRSCLMRWRIHRMDKTTNEEDEVDPITLCPPETPVVLYDWSVKKKFILEANTLALLIESKLLYHEGGFPMPTYPKNPRSNVELSYQQLISIYYQLQTHGELLWGMTTMRHCNFNKKRWFRYHKSAITVAAIKNSISLLDTVNGIDLLSDFIFAKMEELRFNVTRYVTDAYMDAMARVPNHWYLEKWKYIAMVHYEGAHFGEERTRYVNACSFKLCRKQNQFFNELKSLHIIS